ncbi:8977_t:CDS:2 [Acaulospora morrowiae]|uniref:8977_t:CDS:1 n=1 Tax=Acaulospora morrowiae TaxID=94023 RepID=A0A9N8V3Y3_9GLOM|nr:8977_t:CDS:2 [Acaulospora morrowiae]
MLIKNSNYLSKQDLLPLYLYKDLNKSAMPNPVNACANDTSIKQTKANEKQVN